MRSSTWAILSWPKIPRAVAADPTKTNTARSKFRARRGLGGSGEPIPKAYYKEPTRNESLRCRNRDERLLVVAAALAKVEVGLADPPTKNVPDCR